MDSGIKTTKKMKGLFSMQEPNYEVVLAEDEWRDVADCKTFSADYKTSVALP